MTILFGLTAAFFTLFAAGFGITGLVFRAPTRLNLLEVCALSWLFGTGAISLLLWLGGMFVSGLILQLSVAAVSVGLAAFTWLSMRKRHVSLFFPRPRNLMEWLLAGAIVLECVAMFYVALSHALGWDGLMNWEIKARYAFLNNGVMPPSYYSDAARFMTHASYPLWIPLTELWLYLWMGEAHQFWIKLLFPTYYVSGAVLLACCAARLSGRRWIGLVTAGLLFFVPCLTNAPGGVHTGYVDVPISVLYLATFGFLLLFVQSNDLATWRVSALSLAVLPWAKNEGSVLWLIAVICAAAVAWGKRCSWRSTLWLLPGVAIILGWKAFCAAMSMTLVPEFSVTVATLRTNLPRLGWILYRLGCELIAPHHWSIFWPLVLLAFVRLAIRARDQRLLILFVGVIAPIAAYSTTYLFSGWPDWTTHVNASISRLLLHVLPLAWLAIALAMRPPLPKTNETGTLL